MLKKPHYIALGVVLVLTVIVLKLPSRAALQCKLALGSLFLPLFGFTSTTQSVLERAGNATASRKDLLKALEQTKEENQRLKIQLQQAAEMARENEKLRKLLGFQQHSPWKVQMAHVIAWDPANWWRTVQIDRGSRDGMKPNLPVLTSEGLVGRISEVSETRSQVLLLGDPKCRVAAEVQETRDNGIVYSGSGVLDSSLVQLGYLSRASALKPGQAVRTSGLGGIFPKGILIGQIVDFHTVDYGLYTEARVKLAVNLNLLGEVFVKMP
jgi:rod shape-determining protein MreC